jgi:hypothetical protein
VGTGGVVDGGDIEVSGDVPGADEAEAGAARPRLATANVSVDAPAKLSPVRPLRRLFPDLFVVRTDSSRFTPMNGRSP